MKVAFACFAPATITKAAIVAGMVLSSLGAEMGSIWTLPSSEGADGEAWTAEQGNPRRMNGATWVLLGQPVKNAGVDDPYSPMEVSDKGWKLPGADYCRYSARTLVSKTADKTPQKGPASAISFAPPSPGWYRVILEGTLKVQIPQAGRGEAILYVLSGAKAKGIVTTFSAGMEDPQEVPVSLDRIVELDAKGRLLLRLQTINSGSASADNSWLKIKTLTIQASQKPEKPELLLPVALPELPKVKTPTLFTKLPLEPMSGIENLCLRRKDGPVMEEQNADFVLDSFETPEPKFEFVDLRGTPAVQVKVRDGIAAEGGRSLNVFMGVVDKPTGYHESGLVWKFDKPMDLTPFTGITLKYRAQDNAFHSFLLIAGLPGGVLAQALFEPDPGLAGTWQTVTIPARFGLYHEGAKLKPGEALDLSKVSNLRFRLFNGNKEPYAFDLDAIGFIKKRADYQGPRVDLILEGRQVYTNAEPFSLHARVVGTPLPEASELVLATVDFFGVTNWLGRVKIPANTTDIDTQFTVPNSGAGYWYLTGLLRSRNHDLFQATRGLGSVIPLAPEDAMKNDKSIFGAWVGGNNTEIGAKWKRDYVWGNKMKIDEKGHITGHMPGVPAGLDSILHFTYIPQWLSSKPDDANFGKYPPRDWDAYGRYLEEVTKQTKANGFTLYEMWNEPNPYAYWLGSEADVVKIAEVTYKAVKKIQPDAKVLGPCPYGFTFDFIETFFKNGGTNWIDDVVLHTYTPIPADDYFLPGIRKLKELMTQYGLGDRSIYITEMGYSTPAVSERDMASNLVRVYVYGLSEHVKLIIWHMLQALDDKGDPGYALKLKNGMPRPAYVAYAAMTRVLEFADYQGVAPGLTGGQRGFDFVKRGATIRVAWDKSVVRGAKTSYTLKTEGESLRIIDLMGFESTIAPDGNGNCTVELGTDPVYLISTKH